MTRFLALGDSYTIGEGVPEPERWPNQLEERLRARGYSVDVSTIARTGWTTGELLEAMRATPPTGRYGLVSLLIGVNNQYRGLSLDAYRAEFSRLLDGAIQLADGKPRSVIVLSIPDWSVTPFAAGRDYSQISAQIDAFNAVNREISQQADVHYVDVTPASRLASGDPSLLASDQLHPSGRMYSHWAELILPEALAALNEI
ncbi:MAG: SGNH/GDSL hydrolase family protein [Anaerolineaceae bacterium]|nr:MAG: SGNH/GDSL hydrolase family protein [Anaerolineaceae bacterium]